MVIARYTPGQQSMDAFGRETVREGQVYVQQDRAATESHLRAPG